MANVMQTNGILARASQAIMDYVFETGSKTVSATAETLLALFQRHGVLMDMLAGNGGKGTCRLSSTHGHSSGARAAHRTAPGKPAACSPPLRARHQDAAAWIEAPMCAPS